VEEETKLFERYKLAFAEYRAEVSLGWERQRLFLTLNPTLTAIIPLMGKHKLAATFALVVASAVSIAGAFIVSRSHDRYRAARTTLQSIESQLKIEDFQTTGGMREERGLMRLERYKVSTVVIIVLLLNAVLDLVLAAIW
jgi:hypothetical protein